MAMDVNGFAVAPLSFEKLIRTVFNGMNRTWELQAASHYAAVPAVMPSDAPPPSKPKASPKAFSVNAVNPNDLHAFNPSLANVRPLPRRDNAHTGTDGKSASLKNVHMCVLADVPPGAILARDIHDRGGQLLLKTGTELKSSLIARLRSVAQGHGESYHLWVGEREAP
jgi:hypothetical protein